MQVLGFSATTREVADGVVESSERLRVQLGFEFMSATCGNAVSLGWDEYLVVSVATGLVASF